MRLAFAVYACLLFAGTHWPRLAIDMEIGRPDLVVHFLAFGTWMILFNLTAFFGPTLNKGPILRRTALALVYAAFDESTQLITILHRHAGWADFAANVGGILSASCVLYFMAHRSQATRPPGRTP